MINLPEYPIEVSQAHPVINDHDDERRETLTDVLVWITYDKRTGAVVEHASRDAALGHATIYA